jgi:hypothetical protein
LHIAGAVKAGRQTEVPVEESARLSKEIEDHLTRHARSF